MLNFDNGTVPNFMRQWPTMLGENKTKPGSSPSLESLTGKNIDPDPDDQNNNEANKNGNNNARLQDCGGWSAAARQSAVNAGFPQSRQ